VNPTGRKGDAGKLRFTLLPFDAVSEVVRVLMFGANKYGDHNWIAVDNAHERYFDAAMRHLVARKEGERNDPESGLSHLAHAVCCGIFLLAMDLRNHSAMDPSK
jgi:hypothetical protein